MIWHLFPWALRAAQNRDEDRSPWLAHRYRKVREWHREVMGQLTPPAIVEVPPRHALTYNAERALEHGWDLGFVGIDRSVAPPRPPHVQQPFFITPEMLEAMAAPQGPPVTLVPFPTQPQDVTTKDVKAWHDAHRVTSAILPKRRR
jgi:hypothetical protein